MDCLRLQSLTELYIEYVSEFPLYLLDDGEISLKWLGLWGCYQAKYPGTVANSSNQSRPRLAIGCCDKATWDSVLKFQATHTA